MEKWTICNKTGDFNLIGERFGVSPITARLLINRDLKDIDEISAFLNPSKSQLHSPRLLKNLESAAEMLAGKIRDNRRIRVVGDYDVDGIMATYILTNAIKRCGGEVDYYIPHRIKDGYGINAEIIKTAYSEGIDTIITCDNGISAVDAAIEAKKCGITLIVTDHHEAPEVLPEAACIVDAKQPGDTYPCRDICGAVTAAKVAEVLFEKRNISADCSIYLEYMAMATICDVVALRNENRAIAVLGLRQLKQTENPGLAALIKETEINVDSIGEYQIGYILGPCFNATGRIDDAEVALRLLMCDNPAEAATLAAECRILNEERKEITSVQETRAFEILDGTVSDDKVIVLVLPECHESVLGIIAGRVKEKYSKPAIILTECEAGLKGSARSIPEYNMYEELTKCAGLLSKFGGHPMAAGLTLQTENLEAFRRQLNDNCRLTEADMCKKTVIDAEVSFNLFDEKIVEEINMLAPFGQSNATPVFAQKNLRIKSLRYIGRENKFIRLNLSDDYSSYTAVYFSHVQEFLEELKAKYGQSSVDAAFNGRDTGMSIIAAYVPKLNVFRDNKEIQMQIRSIKV